MKSAVILLMVPMIIAFDATFFHGCGSSSCTFKFVMPEKVARFVDPAVLVEQVARLNYSIGVLESLEGTMGLYSDTSDFDTEVKDQANTFTQGVKSTGDLLQKAVLLTKMTNCFQSGGVSKDCGAIGS
ncbi:unnamed protein product [Nippostrongylus brasiliensis]|uniref:Secreted protein n=1 Tax=Nippostrongylus brasiliensis TaxID=27835 RepID=A0A0N4YKS4_NIPBR|nr:unnamed protein product [Nippostrongylus brasiliensis]